MIRNICLFVVSFFLFTSSFACMQGMRMLSDGTVIARENQSLTVPRGSILVHQDEEALRRLEGMWKSQKDINYLSDYAMALVVNGNYEEAKNNYLKLEKIKPNQYATASNLGTVYELLGDNKNALTWIQKALQLNHASHDSSEWLHVRILEAKIGGDRFMNTNFLLHTDFGKDSMPASKLSKEELERLRKALFYQLNERLTFIHSQDKVVAQLLFDLADLSLLTGMNIYLVNDIYSMAKKYGYADPLWEKRSTYAKHLSLKINRNQGTTSQVDGNVVAPAAETSLAGIITLGICLLLFPVLAFLFLKKRLESNKMPKRYL